MENSYFCTLRCYIVIMFLSLFSMTSFSQAIPKRDFSKDKKTATNTVVKKNNNEIKNIKKTNQSNKSIGKRLTKKESEKIHKKNVYRKKHAPTYIFVDSKTHVDYYAPSQYCTKTFFVDTNRNDWDIVYVPTWCNVTRFSNSFSLTCEANPTHAQRKDWFVVKSGDAQVTVNIVQEGAPIQPIAYFSTAYIEHNLKIGYDKDNYLKISGNLNLSGLKGLRCKVIAAFYDDTHREIKSSNPIKNKYGITEYKQLTEDFEIQPRSDDNMQYSFIIYVRNDDMILTNKNNRLICHLSLFIVDTRKYISDIAYDIYFSAQKKKGKIITSY